jgi:hypothetical protein
MTEVLDEMQTRAWESYSLLSAAFDEQLWQQANDAKGHISCQAVSEEYERLVRAKQRAIGMN